MKGTILAAALAAGLSITTTAANAADLGGNCCADLEDRIAELEATTARKGNRKMSLTIYGQVNAAILESILAGRETGPKRDMVLMNAGAALACAGLADDMGDGIGIAREMISSGAALERLRLLQKASQV